MKHPLRSRYYNMLIRCYNIKSPKYTNWGARGITVCEEWRDKKSGFANYARHLESLPNAYAEGYLIDRIDNEGNYEPGNVRWATSSEQNLNKRIPCTNKSGQINIRFKSNVWEVNFRHKYIGSFKTLGEAIVARDRVRVSI